MTLSDKIEDAIRAFNGRQNATRRRPLGPLERTVLRTLIRDGVAEYVHDTLRDEVEAALMTEREYNRDHEIDMAYKVIMVLLSRFAPAATCVVDTADVRAIDDFALQIERLDDAYKIHLVRQREGDRAGLNQAPIDVTQPPKP